MTQNHKRKRRLRPDTGGRPSKLTPELQEKLCNYIRAGMFETTSVGACGIAPQTFREWMRRGSGTDGRSTNPQFAAFAAAVRLARAEARGAAEIEVRQKDPKFWLTHADPEWAEVKRLEIIDRSAESAVTPLTDKQRREEAIETLRIMYEVGIIEDERDKVAAIEDKRNSRD